MAKAIKQTIIKKASFNIDLDLLWRFQYVTMMKNETQTEVIAQAIDTYVNSYKGKIPEMPPPKKKK